MQCSGEGTGGREGEGAKWEPSCHRGKEREVVRGERRGKRNRERDKM